MSDLLDGISGEFIHIDCNIFPVTSFFYRDRKVLKTENVNNLKEYVFNMVDKLGVGKLNLIMVEKYEESMNELIINEHGVIRISLKGETNGKSSTE